MAMPLIDRRVGRQTIEIAATVNVPEPDAEAAGEYDIERLVITRAVFALKGVIAVARRRRRTLSIVCPCSFWTSLHSPIGRSALFGREPRRVGFDAAAVET